MTKGSRNDASQKRDMNAVRTAYQDKDVEKMMSEHERQPLLRSHKEDHGGSASQYIKSIVFGGLDGILTAFAVVTAAAGAGDRVRTDVVLIFGFANLLADGFAMGFGEYTSSKAEMDYAEAERRREEWELENFAEGERQEMISLYEQKGFSLEDATKLMDVFMKYPKQFVDLMMVEELGIMPEDADPWEPVKQGCVMYCAFVTFGSVPLLAYIPNESPFLAFIISCALTAVCMALLGSLKGVLAKTKWWKSALQMLLNGILAAIVSYSVSYFISRLVAKGPDNGQVAP